MIRTVSDIIEKNYMKVDILDSVRRIQDICYNEDIECFAAFENKKLVGVITKKELVNAHPNRIVADVMSIKYACVSSSTPIWSIEEMFNLHENINTVLVEEENQITGFVTGTTLNIELGKHIDLLTGLYKSDYILYNAYNLIKNGQDVTVIFIDLNKFGYIDKKYGHIVGDTILKKLAEVLKGNITNDSYLCRYAGDEFVILTPNCMDGSKILAEKIIKAIDAFEFPNNISVSVSIGITGYKLNNKKVDNVTHLINELINTASLASTEAKLDVNNTIMVRNADIDAVV